MPNDASAWPDKGKMKEGMPPSSNQMKRIVDSLARRIVGDNKTIRVRTFGNQIIIEAMPARTVPSGSPFTINKVNTLPPIPEAGFKFVLMEDVDGKVKLWFATNDYERWFCLDQYTNDAGDPPPPEVE